MVLALVTRTQTFVWTDGSFLEHLCHTGLQLSQLEQVDLIYEDVDSVFSCLLVLKEYVTFSRMSLVSYRCSAKTI